MKFFLPILFLLLTGGIFFGYTNPAYVHVKDLQAQQSQYDEALSKARELQSVRDQLVARYNTFSPDDLTKLQKLLPDHVDNVRLILDLDTMASRYGMRVRNVTIDTASQKSDQQIGPSDKTYESVILSFSISGSYDTFRQYLNDLEHSLRLVDVTGVQFIPNTTGIYDFQIQLQTYWLAP